MRSLLTLTILAGVALAGCGPANTLTKAEAAKAFNSTSPALSTGSSMNSAQNALNATVTQSATESCPKGGTRSVNLKASGTDLNMSVAGDFVYNKCSHDGLNFINGGLAVRMDMAQSGTDLAMKMAMTGGLSFTGEVNGQCAVNLSVEVGSGTTTSAKVTGTFCGFDVNDLEGSVSTN